MITNTSTKKISYQYLSCISAVYAFFFMLPSLLLRKMIDIPYFGIIPISILFTGIYFMLLDVVTEVYGYREGRKILFSAWLVYTLFVLLMELMIQIPSPSTYHIAWSSVQDNNAYTYLFHNLYLVWISVSFCTLFANTLNILILSKWKVLLHGKYFWMRSITTSFFTALIYSFVSNLFAFGFFLNASQIPYLFKLLFISMMAKLITLIIFAYPATLFCNYLKKKEEIDTYDYSLNYNPFQRLNKK